MPKVIKGRLILIKEDPRRRVYNVVLPAKGIVGSLYIEKGATRFDRLVLEMKDGDK